MGPGALRGGCVSGASGFGGVVGCGVVRRVTQGPLGTFAQHDFERGRRPCRASEQGR